MNIDSNEYYYTLYSENECNIDLECYKFGRFKYNNSFINCLLCSYEIYFCLLNKNLPAIY